MQNKIIVLIADWSKECKSVVDFWKKMKKQYDFDLEILNINKKEGAELMDEYEISSVPATIINNEVEFIGMPELKRVEELFEI